jgi:translation initiation factor IF-2
MWGEPWATTAVREGTMAEQKIGRVTHYWAKIGVAGIEITAGEVRVGDTIRFKGHTTDFNQRVDSMQVEHEPVTVARAGDSVGLQVADHVRDHDEVFKVTED